MHEESLGIYVGYTCMHTVQGGPFGIQKKGLTSSQENYGMGLRVDV